MISRQELFAHLKGLVSFLPGSGALIRNRGTQSAQVASYYYGIWLKHLSIMWQSGYQKIPDTIAELGPGDSLGVGLAALLSGANKYYALDVVKYSNTELNLRIFDDLVELFNRRSPRPHKGWPDFDHLLNEKLFPAHILTNHILEKALQPKRVQEIRNAILNQGSGQNVQIKYIVPWMESQELEEDSIDFCFSHTVLQYADDLDKLFNEIYRLLRSNSLMSHQIDLSAHNTSDIWNGHRKFSELSWRLIKGNRPYFLNRLPFSAYGASLKTTGFNVVCELKQTRTDGIRRSAISPNWQHLDDLDLHTSGAFIQAQKSS